MILALECSNLNLNFALGLFIFPQKLEFVKKETSTKFLRNSRTEKKFESNFQEEDEI